MNSSKIYKDINFIETLELNSLNGIMGGVSVGSEKCKENYANREKTWHLNER